MPIRAQTNYMRMFKQSGKIHVNLKESKISDFLLAKTYMVL